MECPHCKRDVPTELEWITYVGTGESRFYIGRAECPECRKVSVAAGSGSAFGRGIVLPDEPFGTRHQTQPDNLLFAKWLVPNVTVPNPNVTAPKQ